ncbi:unnamed protein product [Thelazia callipaeda]|uniref:RNA helicase n=1 Tax=Thelazia callipaeda TaxID=103827 RepID=A0A0N5DBP8_THECL|nr:unnamed protein product [Thelazia callipaeda]
MNQVANSLPDAHTNDDFLTLLKNDEQFRLGHLRLYKAELLEAVNSVEKILLFSDFFDKESLESLTEMYLDEPNQQTALSYFWYGICFKREAIDRLLSIAMEDQKSLFDLIHEDIHENSLIYYRKMFDGDPAKMDKITLTLEPLPICIRLGHEEYGPIKRVVQEMMKSRKYDEASCYLMRNLPRVQKKNCKASDWYFDFLNACLGDAINCSIPEVIDADYKAHLDIYFAQNRVTAPHNKSSTSCGLPESMYAMEEPEKPENRTQEQYKKYRIKAFSDEVMELVEDAEPIELRPYQQELVESACRGVNTIICAPTGSGKTVVAAHIILEHFRKMKSINKPSRVAMLVPTVPLVEQQCIMFNRYLRKIFWVDGMCGSEPVDEAGRAPYVLASYLTVFTPQIFINLLKSVRREDRLYFTDFTLFVFDECHHCDGEHPYNVLMRMLHRFDGPKPQIVGLTASLPLGAGRANVEAALDHMMDLCAKLSAHSISTVRKHVDNLRHHVKPPVDEIRRAFRPEFDNFVHALEICMKKIELSMKPELEKICESKLIHLKMDDITFPSQKSTVRYESLVGSLKNRIGELPGSRVKHQIMKMLNHLGYYCRALSLADLLPNWYAYCYLRDNMKEEIAHGDVGDTCSIQVQLEKLFEKFMKPNELNFQESDNGEEKEILKILHTILRDQYISDPTSRTIIFVTTRKLAQCLSTHLNNVRVVDGSNRAVGYITSSNQSTASSGQTTDEQRVTIEKFNQGVIKVLVATSVAEEGLDISACNLIIKYNNTGSERSLIQRRGRARAKHSKSVLIALDGSIEERELENIQKEFLMRRCLEHMQTMSERQMRQMASLHTLLFMKLSLPVLVENKINQTKALQEADILREKERKRVLEGKCYDLKCRLCGAFICKSSSMRIACDSQYVCCDPTIWGRISAQAHDAKSVAIATLVGKSYCKGDNETECNEVLGTIVKLYGAFLPTITAKAIFIDDEDAPSSIRPHYEKKWDVITSEKFCVDPITESDLKIMLNSLYTYSQEKHMEFEAEAVLAVQRAVADMKKK